jgi:hypothetical protein
VRLGKDVLSYQKGVIVDGASSWCNVKNGFRNQARWKGVLLVRQCNAASSINVLPNLPGEKWLARSWRRGRRLSRGGEGRIVERQLERTKGETIDWVRAGRRRKVTEWFVVATRMSVRRDNSTYSVRRSDEERVKEDEGASFMGRRQATAIPAVWIVGLGWRAI